MSIPRDHHYLPQFYTGRWTVAGKVYRYVRPTPSGSLHQKNVAPAAVGYRRDLYAYSVAASEMSRQRLELEFFQAIDDRAAVALTKLDNSERGSVIDKVGLVQFVISLLHRSPSRIENLRTELEARMSDVRHFDPSNSIHQELIRDQINDLLTELISSTDVVRLIAHMKVFRIEVVAKHRLLTGDLPLMLSQGIAQPLGFLMFPYAPTKIAIIAHEEGVAAAFSTQDPDALAKAINDAVVTQAREVVIASDERSRRFIENRFAKNPEPIPGDGLMRWVVP